jgi:hypothetical protein
MSIAENETGLSKYLPFAAATLAVGATMFLLRSQGRLWWCKQDNSLLWASDIWSAHSSQHIFDPYSLTHFLHGFLFFFAIWIFFRGLRPEWKFSLMILIECGWELLENSDFILERYRAVTISLDYWGDSIFNSLGDLVSCSLGFLVASRLKWMHSLAVYFAAELIALFWFRDNLTLNIIMLIYPIEAIKTWQMIGAPV